MLVSSISFCEARYALQGTRGGATRRPLWPPPAPQSLAPATRGFPAVLTRRRPGAKLASLKHGALYSAAGLRSSARSMGSPGVPPCEVGLCVKPEKKQHFFGASVDIRSAYAYSLRPV